MFEKGDKEEDPFPIIKINFISISSENREE